MSSAGNLATGAYTSSTVAMARRHPDFVMGFVAMRRVDEDEVTAGGVKVGEGADYVIMTPGVGLETKGDGMGQQYRTPKEVIGESGCDVIIVGRGIYGGGEGAEDSEIVGQCRIFKEAGWKAYQDRLA